MSTKKYLLIFIILLSTMQCAKKIGKPVVLTGPWYFQIDAAKVGLGEEWFRQDADLFHTRQLSSLGAWEAITSPDYDGWGWYFTNFVGEGRAGKMALSFDAVDDNAFVWLNGQKVGEHHGAHVSFKIDISKQVKKGINRLVILVEDTGGFGGLIAPVEIVPFKDDIDLLKGKYYDIKPPTHPKWAENAVIYELNTRQFTPEGTFKAIEPRIRELKDLGVTIIWFMPIHPIGEQHRKGTLGSYYAVKDYYGINPEFGTLADFERLVQRIHAEGMYVIIDLVANHTAWDNPLTEQRPEWYTLDKYGNFRPPVPDWTDVADLNYEIREVWRYMIDVMKYWVGDVGIDGFRCDVAAMVPTDFWIQARQELDAIKAVFMLAEAETPELNAYGFDMTYAGSMHRLFNDIARGTASPRKIDEYLQYENYQYPPGSMRLRFTSNHDENSWNQSEIIRMGTGGAKVGAVLNFTLPGTPLIYTGQEVGNEKALKFFERDPVIWEENEFRPFYRTLAKTYTAHPALYQGDFRKLTSDNDDQIFAFTRKFANDEAVVIVNFSSQAFAGAIHFKNVSGEFNDIFDAGHIKFSGQQMKFDVEPWAYRVYIRQK